MCTDSDAKRWIAVVFSAQLLHRFIRFFLFEHSMFRWFNFSAQRLLVKNRLIQNQIPIIHLLPVWICDEKVSLRCHWYDYIGHIWCESKWSHRRIISSRRAKTQAHFNTFYFAYKMAFSIWFHFTVLWSMPDPKGKMCSSHFHMVFVTQWCMWKF